MNAEQMEVEIRVLKRELSDTRKLVIQLARTNADLVERVSKLESHERERNARI